MRHGALEDSMYDTGCFTERGIQWLPFHQPCGENGTGEVACAVEVTVEERAVGQYSLIPRHSDHRDAVVIRHRGDDDKVRSGEASSRSDDVVKGARLGSRKDAQLGKVWHHNVGVLNGIRHQ